MGQPIILTRRMTSYLLRVCAACTPDRVDFADQDDTCCRRAPPIVCRVGAPIPEHLEGSHRTGRLARTSSGPSCPIDVTTLSRRSRTAANTQTQTQACTWHESQSCSWPLCTRMHASSGLSAHACTLARDRSVTSSISSLDR